MLWTGNPHETDGHRRSAAHKVVRRGAPNRFERMLFSVEMQNEFARFYRRTLGNPELGLHGRIRLEELSRRVQFWS